VIIQVIMVSIVIAFPGIVTSHVSKAVGSFSGSATDEINRQLANPGGTPAAQPPAPGQSPSNPKGEDASSEIERMLRQQ